VLTYSFRITWRWQEVQKIDRKTIKILTVCKMHHPKSNTHRLYVKMEEEGRELVTNWGDTQIRDNLYCRLLEDKT
jgi:hypothetical protein